MGNSQKVNQLSSQRLLVALDEAAAKLEAVERAKTEPIAIVGMSCRFPGGANDPEAFWRVLRDGVDAIAQVPESRWDVDAYYDSNPDAPGKIYTRSGGFLQQVDQFEPQFFGISPREAQSLDPQQRLLLEVSWEALENAGAAPNQLFGSRTGIFVGIGQNDYAHLQRNSDNPAHISAYDGTGNGFCFASGRLSHVLGLQGPNIALDTACSSSLVSVHLACQSLRAGECELALAGGVHLILSPEVTIFLSRARALSPDGRCKTFDAAADGYGRGEGCGILVLKRLSKAIADGDNILALIRGSAVNHDGKSSGITVPNKLAQQAVIRQALANAKVEPSQVSYVEAHGTGTSLGDPIEVRALGAVLGEGRSPEYPLAIGSVKTNIGHLEAAAGVAGLIKVVLALQHREIPPHLHFNQPNPYINWNEFPVVVPTEPTPWRTASKQRIAGVSSFSISGTNAHILLEEAAVQTPVKAEVERPLHVLTLSAKTQEALKQLALRYEEHLTANSALALGDICFTANTGRLHFNHRLSVVAPSVSELCKKLAAFTAGQEAIGVKEGEVQGTSQPKVAFLFTGQGAQYVDMGRRLYEQAPTFRKTLDQCAEILRPYLDKPLLEVLYPENGEREKGKGERENPSPCPLPLSPLDETAYTQPALFALEYALFRLWESWGIKPDVVMGHSVGEYVAATVAGVFSLEDGLKLIAARSRLMQALPQDGEMVAVLADPVSVAAALEPYRQQVAIAAVNGPQSLVISGERQAVKAVCAALEAQGVKTKPLQVSHAFHSPLMQPMLEEFRQVACEVTYRVPQVKLISNLTGQLVREKIATPEYWCRHILSPVQFATSMETLQQQGYEVFVECGPKSTLLGMARHCLPQEGRLWLPSLHPGQDDWQQLLQSLAQLYVRGVSVDWTGFDLNYQRRRLVLPTYPFQRQRYWADTTANGKPTNGSSTSLVTETRIINLLHQGDTQQLTQQLAAELDADEVRYLPKVLEVIARQHQQQLQATSIKDWLYQIEWQPSPRRQTDRVEKLTQKGGSWLIFSDWGGVGKSLAELLQQQGQSCFLVYAGESYQRQETGWSLNPSCHGDYERLFQEVASSELPLKQVVHLWSLEATQPEQLTIPALQQAQTWGCESVLHLVQALVKHGAASPRLWLITRGAMPVASTLSAVAQAPVWGLGKVVALEHPELWGGMLDLAPESTADEATALLAEISDSQGEDHLAFRSDQRYVARLVPSETPEPQKVPFRSNCTYLITGGLGALGLKIAQWMVDAGARYLVLTGRRGASTQAQSTITSMEQTGAKVLVAQADVSELTDMSRVLESVEASMPPLRGIVHAAGVVGYETIKDIDLNTFKSVLRPKVLGTWILHQLTQEMKLDFFVNFSSIASVWGSKGQAHYAAANHFLDALAYYRQGLGLPALSVNWGPWAEGGMASEEAQQLLNRMGVNALQPEQTLTALGVLLGGNCPQTTVANVDWTRFKGIYEARGQRPLLEKIETQQREAAQQQREQRSEILQQLDVAPKSEREALLIAYLQTEVAKILGLELSQLPKPQQGFFEMGMDSLMAVELKERLEASLGSELPATLAFESPNIKDLAEYLGREVLGWNSLVTDVKLLQQDERSLALSKIEQLSEYEVEASIAERLVKLDNLVRDLVRAN